MEQDLNAIAIDGVPAWGYPYYNETSFKGAWVLPHQPVGSHIVAAQWGLSLYRPGASSPAMIWDTSLSMPFRVVAAASAEGLVELDRPELKDDIRSRITVQFIERTIPPVRCQNVHFPANTSDVASVGFPLQSTSTTVLAGTLKLANLPCDVAFEIYLREGNKEQSAGMISVARGGACESTVWLPQPGTPPLELFRHIDLILRSSAKAARESVDVTEFWKGEIVFPNLRIEHRGPISPFN